MKATWLKWISIALIGFSILSCSDDRDSSDEVQEPETSDLANEQLISKEMDAALNMGSEVTLSEEGGRVTADFSFCASLDWDKPNRTIVLDFGAGCTSENGITRSGKITITYTGSWLTQNLAQVVTYDNFKVGGYSLNGTFNTTQLTHTGTIYSFGRIASNITLGLPDGKLFNYSASHTYSITEGAETWRNPFDNVYEISGSSSGTNSEGEAFTNTITTPLQIKSACWLEGIVYPVSGVTKMDYASPQSIDFSIDFGSGACDKMATITAGRFSQTIELP